jgi:hypothetical protein
VDPGEECDPGAGYAPPACSFYCAALDFRAVNAAPPSGLSQATRTLGSGRHPLAVSTNGELAVSFISKVNGGVTVSIATLDAQGNARGVPIALASGSHAQAESDPVVASTSAGRYVAAWADFDGDGDELGILLRSVDANGTSSANVVANTTTAASQHSADMIFTGSQIVVAWVDDSNAETAPDLRMRTFNADLTPTSSEQTLTATAARESDVVLAPFAGSFAAAWRSVVDGAETIYARAGSAEWTVTVPLAGPTGNRPALAALDATHLVLVYSEGVDSEGTGVANGSKLRAAVLDVASPGSVLSVDVPGATHGAQSQPNAIRAAGEVYVAWRVAGTPGDSNGEDVVIKAVRLGAGGGVELNEPEMPMTRGERRSGDQRAPALAASGGGTLVSGWDDLGRNLGHLEWNRDVVLNVAAVPLVRGGDVAAAVDLERFPGRERNLYCQRLAECCLQPERFDYVSCNGFAGAGFGNINTAKSLFGDGNIHLSKSLADACLRETVSVDCVRESSVDYSRWTHTCASALVGAIAPSGTGCRDAFECSGNSYCAVPAGASVGMCLPLKAEGESCTDARECTLRAVAGANLYCSGTAAAPGTCTRTRADSAACAGSLECASGICRTVAPNQRLCVGDVPMTDPGVAGGVCDRFTTRD